MGLAIFDGLVKQEAVFFFIACVAGLEKTPGRRDGLIDAHVLTAVDDFQLVAPLEAHLYLPQAWRAATSPSVRKSDGSPPVMTVKKEGYSDTAATISSVVMSRPSSWDVSQNGQRRLQPEKRTKTAGVPVW